MHLEDEGNDRVRHDFWFLAWMTVWVVAAILETRNTGGGAGLEEARFGCGHVAFETCRRQ